ncbi:hypothetical protein CU097_005902 [Rhizopus azygosporus]|uniref:Uncharacterized protein n=1 Tax=Rhizopus azygosporus TaxID=86630 RepID=A0A367JJ26_RHIAZ|nr:hypothetical protein CU097_005902 [Rhizopus azygosporus]
MTVALMNVLEAYITVDVVTVLDEVANVSSFTFPEPDIVVVGAYKMAGVNAVYILNPRILIPCCENDLYQVVIEGKPLNGHSQEEVENMVKENTNYKPSHIIKNTSEQG